MKRKYLAFGDSLTNGYGVLDKYKWRNIVGKHLNVQIENYGVNGETASEAKKRLVHVLEYKPDIAFINFGTNDIFVSQDQKGFVDLKQYQRDMTDLIKPMKDIGTRVIWLSPHRIIEGDKEKRTYFFQRHKPEMYAKHSPNALLEQCTNVAKETAQKLDVEFIDLFHDKKMHNLEQVLRTMENSGEEDGVHYSNHGSQIVADIIIEYLEGVKI
ncbi:MAG TPA: SGNH/GDSL hydrolase family protein [Erysipelothrix sp.]